MDYKRTLIEGTLEAAPLFFARFGARRLLPQFHPTFETTMRRKVAAFITFNAYWVCFVSAFFHALPELFRLDFSSTQIIPDLRLKRFEWDHRYLLFLLLSAAATSLSAVLAGAVAKKRGGVIAAKSALPLTLVWIEMFFVSLFTGTFGATLLSLTAIPLTILVSSYFGNLGERMQSENFSEATIFGICPYHLIWMIVPCFLSAFVLAAWLPHFESALFHNWLQAGLSGTIGRLLSLIYILLPILGLAGLLYLVYKVLTGRIFKIESEWGRAVLTIGLLVVVPVVLYRLLVWIGWLMKWIPGEGG